MNCFVCGANSEKFLDKKSNIEYYSCQTCECIFKSPDLHGSLKEQKERYDLHENNIENEGYRAYFQRFVDYILPLMNKPESALDFGCGGSTLLEKILQENGIDCDSYDPIYHPDLQYNSKKYQLITSVEVFEHLHYPKEVFAELIGLIEEGGYLAIRTEFSPLSLDLFLKWYYILDPTHILFFRKKTFEELCRQNECEIISCDNKNMILMRKNISRKY